MSSRYFLRFQLGVLHHCSLNSMQGHDRRRIVRIVVKRAPNLGGVPTGNEHFERRIRSEFNDWINFSTVTSFVHSSRASMTMTYVSRDETRTLLIGSTSSKWNWSESVCKEPTSTSLMADRSTGHNRESIDAIVGMMKFASSDLS